MNPEDTRYIYKGLIAGDFIFEYMTTNKTCKPDVLVFTTRINNLNRFC